MSCTRELFELWRAARLKFMADFPATAKALALSMPDINGLEHATDPSCWCGPEIVYTDPETAVSVFVHQQIL